MEIFQRCDFELREPFLAMGQRIWTSEVYASPAGFASDLME